jgi:hypothetical protein
MHDETSKNWWLAVAGTQIGYFPENLFTNLATANTVGWGGLIATPMGISPPMGSGLFLDRTYIHACYFTFIGYLDKHRRDIDPAEYLTDKFLNAPAKCYADTGATLEFGGPTGNCGN